ncbi:hypothetical protein Pmani_028530 [Petrolisthes manimaculis]|uniref:Uncharacterized protein n=1 Tax=Petrolisthes manimaculis TaxID=1843537 RepID=A0AAE1P1Z2_9EUCA|nr:hypothetical protein Pmani_028530 [Petrolisthes manimaculis]
MTVAVVVMMMIMVVGGVEGEQKVAASSPFCSDHTSFLTCDYKGNDEIVFLERLSDAKKVYIHNAQHLVVLEDVCLGLGLFNVDNVTFSVTPSISCSHLDHISLKLVNTAVNLVPGYITHLDMQGSKAGSVECHRELRQITVVHSAIDTLEVMKPIRGIHIKFDHTTIGTLKNLEIEERANLIFFNVTVGTLMRNSIRLHDASGLIFSSDIKHSHEQAIVLDSKSTLSIKGIDNRVTFAGPKDTVLVPQDISPTPQSNEADSKDNSNAPQTGTKTPPDSVTIQPEMKPPVVPPDVPAKETATSTSIPHTEKPPGVPPGVPAKHTATSIPHIDLVEDCPNPSVLLWAVPTILAAVEAIIIIINCTNWFPSLRGRKHKRGPEELGRIAVTGGGGGWTGGGGGGVSWGGGSQGTGGGGGGWGGEAMVGTSGSQSWEGQQNMGGNTQAYQSWYYSSDDSQHNYTNVRQRTNE